jgi:hypothetical protein
VYVISICSLHSVHGFLGAGAAGRPGGGGGGVFLTWSALLRGLGRQRMKKEGDTMWLDRAVLGFVLFQDYA